MTISMSVLALVLAFAGLDAKSPCTAYSDASSVFVGVVIGETSVPSPDPGPDGMRSRSMPRPIRIVTLRVEATLFGPASTAVRLVDGDRFGMMKLTVGQRFLVYAASRPGNRLPADADRIRAVPIADAAEDLAYLQATTPDRAAFVSGRVSRLDFDTPREKLVEWPVADVEVVLERDGKQFAARTAADGTFILPAVPAGRYRIRSNPATDTSNLVDNELTVPERGCASAQLTILPHASVAGRLVDSAGAPVVGVDVMIVPAGRSAISGNYWVRTTDEVGSFRFDAMPPGRYNVGADIVARAYGPGTYGPHFFPGVADRDKAGTIVVGTEGTVDAGRLVVPAAPPTRGVWGRVSSRSALPDRTSVLVRNVRAVDGYARQVDVKDGGAFEFDALLGETYVIEARGGGLSSRTVRVRVDGHVEGVEIFLDRPMVK